MLQKQTILLIIVFVFVSLACSSADYLYPPATPTVTATFELARFTTSTPTPPVTDTATPRPTNTASPTRPTTATTEPIAILEDSASTDDDAEENSSFDSPVATPTATVSPTPAESPTPTLPPPTPTPEPTATNTATPAPLAGRIAFPVDDGGGNYDVWVMEVPDGDPFIVQPRARQPSFSKDGRLLVNLENSSSGDSLALLDVNYTWLGVINTSPHDELPYWHPDGTRYVYSNPRLLLNPATGNPWPYLFSPCSLRYPPEENEPKCRDIPTFGKITVGESPVWTDDDRVAYLSFEGEDGIYVVSNVSALWQAGGVGNGALLVNGNGRPSDTDGFQVFFSAGSIDQNWEAYAIDLDGTNLINLSNAPAFHDGLPTVSPDGNWVAFVSNRDGKWGIWVLPRSGGEPTKLLDLSTINTNPSPWGVDERDWTRERISWGP